MSEHTPGPWVVEHDAYDDALHVTTAARVEANKVYIAKIEVGFNEPFEGEQRANAAFIVKAVNSHDKLLEALQAVRDAFQTELGSDGSIQSVSYDNEALRPMLAKVYAALSQEAQHAE